MSLNRREFLRRVVGGSALLITGLVSAWELFQNLSPNAATDSSSTTEIQLPPPPPTTETVSQTVTEQQTVTVVEQTVTDTKYVSGPSTQQSSTSSQTSKQTSQQTSQTSQQTSQQTSPTTSSTTTTTTSSTTTDTPVPAGYVLVAPMSALAGKTSAYFNHPSLGKSILLNFGGQWNAFVATCTHAPCTVQYKSSEIYCPCHSGHFNPSTGAVTGGPPPRPLHQFGVLIQNNNIYVTTT